MLKLDEFFILNAMDACLDALDAALIARRKVRSALAPKEREEAEAQYRNAVRTLREMVSTSEE